VHSFPARTRCRSGCVRQSGQRNGRAGGISRASVHTLHWQKRAAAELCKNVSAGTAAPELPQQLEQQRHEHCTICGTVKNSARARRACGPREREKKRRIRGVAGDSIVRSRVDSCCDLAWGFRAWGSAEHLCGCPAEGRSPAPLARRRNRRCNQRVQRLPWCTKSSHSCETLPPHGPDHAVSSVSLWLSESCSFKLCGCTIIVTHSPSKLPPSVSIFVRIIGAPKRAARNVQTDCGCSGGWFVNQKRVSAATPCFRLGYRSSSRLPNNLAVKQVLDGCNVYRSYTTLSA
jgi:hypothetical protein